MLLQRESDRARFFKDTRGSAPAAIPAISHCKSGQWVWSPKILRFGDNTDLLFQGVEILEDALERYGKACQQGLPLQHVVAGHNLLRTIRAHHESGPPRISNNIIIRGSQRKQRVPARLLNHFISHQFPSSRTRSFSASSTRPGGSPRSSLFTGGIMLYSAT